MNLPIAPSRMPPHVIETLCWTSSGGDRAQAVAHQARVSEYLRGPGRQLLDRLFTRLSPSDEVWCLDTLEVDLGRLPANTSFAEWSVRLEQALWLCLHDARRAALAPAGVAVDVDTPGASNVRPSDERALEHFLHYLQRGHLPWAVSPRAGRELADWLARLAQRFGLGLWVRLQRLHPAGDVLLRLGRIAPHHGLQALLAVRDPELAAGLQLLDAQLLAPLHAGGRLSVYQLHAIQQAWRVAGLQALWGQHAGGLSADRLRRLREALAASLAQQLGHDWRRVLRQPRHAHSRRATGSALGESLLIQLLRNGREFRASVPVPAEAVDPAHRDPVLVALIDLLGATQLDPASLCTRLAELRRHQPHALQAALRTLALQRAQRRDWRERWGLPAIWPLLSVLATPPAPAYRLAKQRHSDAQLDPRDPAAVTLTHGVAWAESLRQFALHTLASGALGRNVPGLSALQAWLADVCVLELALGGRPPQDHAGWTRLWQRTLRRWPGAADRVHAGEHMRDSSVGARDAARATADGAAHAAAGKTPDAALSRANTPHEQRAQIDDRVTALHPSSDRHDDPVDLNAAVDQAFADTLANHSADPSRSDWPKGADTRIDLPDPARTATPSGAALGNETAHHEADANASVMAGTPTGSRLSAGRERADDVNDPARFPLTAAAASEDHAAAPPSQRSDNDSDDHASRAINNTANRGDAISEFDDISTPVQDAGSTATAARGAVSRSIDAGITANNPRCNQGHRSNTDDSGHHTIAAVPSASGSAATTECASLSDALDASAAPPQWQSSTAAEPASTPFNALHSSAAADIASSHDLSPHTAASRTLDTPHAAVLAALACAQAGAPPVDTATRLRLLDALADPSTCAQWLRRSAPAQRWTLLERLFPHDRASLRAASAVLHLAHARACPMQSAAQREQAHWQFLARHLLIEGLPVQSALLARRYALHLAATQVAVTPRPSALAHWLQRLRRALRASAPAEAPQRQRLLAAMHRALRALPTQAERGELLERVRNIAASRAQTSSDTVGISSARAPSLLPSVPPDHDTDAEIRHYLSDAGLVLLATWTPRLFARLDLLDGNRLRDPAAAARAVRCLAWLTHGHDHASEPECVLPRLLCGLDLTALLAASTPLDADTTALLDTLLQSLIAHWTALGQTSVNGLRQTFLQREGRLAHLRDSTPPHWHLAVAPGPFDMLLDRLPWSFATLKLPWMPEVLHVQWR